MKTSDRTVSRVQKIGSLAIASCAHEAFITLVCNEICGFIPVDKVSRLMIEGGINSCTSTRRCQGAFVSDTALSNLQACRRECLLEFLLQRYNDLFGKSESVTFSVDCIDLSHSILSLSMILLPTCVLYARAN